MRYFTVDEAEALIPQLETIFAAALAIAQNAREKAARVESLEHGRGTDPSELAIERGQLQFLSRELSAQFDKIARLGALPKGLEPALADFPARLDGREIYLCWRLGEKEITAYHGVDEGFAGRKALPRARR